MSWAFWVALAVMLSVAAAFLVGPLLARRTARPARDYDLAVYRDQLAEVERDRARGLLSDVETGAARLEIERRILAVGERPADPAGRAPMRRWVGAGVVVVLLAAAVPTYLGLGTPIAPTPSADSAADLGTLAERLAARMAAEPGDAEGWALLGRTYGALGKGEAALDAWRNAANLAPDRLDIQLAYAEAVLEAVPAGVPPPPAFAEAVERARAIDPDNPLVLYFDGVAKAAAGDRAGALALWRGLLERMPAGSEQRAALQRQVDALGGATAP